MQLSLLPLNQIKIPDYRQRKDFDGEKLAELMDSISKNGLLQPIVVRNGDTLVAGERRLRAVTLLAEMGEGYRCAGADVSAGFVAAVDFGTLDPLAAEEAELEENTCRVDLTWQERASATSRLADLRRKQALLLGRPVPAVGQIAEEVRGSSDGRNHEDTRRELILAPHLADPEIAKAKSLKEGFEILKRREEVKKNVEHAKVIGATYSKDQLQLIKGDCIEWMASQPDGQFDVIVTDPPYGINAQDFGDADGRLKSQTHVYDDSVESWRVLMGRCSREWYRLARSEAHLYVCCDVDRFVELKGILGDDGWECHRTPIVNYKRDGARVPWIYWGPQRKWELVLYAMKGKKPVTKIYPDVIETTGDENLGHGAQKPVELYRNLLARSCMAGNKVLDTFAGTGTVLAAAWELRLQAVAVEADENYYGIAAKRLQGLK